MTAFYDLLNISVYLQPLCYYTSKDFNSDLETNSHLQKQLKLFQID
jgi:hypothetical protein